MLDVPMARRQRSRTRARRAQDAASRHVAPPRPERDGGARPGVHRGARLSRTGYARALGAPSQSLERAAVLERGYIAKDFRRLAVVIAIALVVLVAAGYLESVLLK